MNEHYTPTNKTADEIRFDIELFKRFAPTNDSLESIRKRGVLNKNRRGFNLGDVLLTLVFYGLSIALVTAAIFAVIK